MNFTFEDYEALMNDIKTVVTHFEKIRDSKSNDYSSLFGETKEDYLIYVEDYKDMAQEACDISRELKRLMKFGDIRLFYKMRSMSQSLKALLANATTLLIEVRRFGKKWSASKREEVRVDAGLKLALGL